jgi:hypothetical protein
MLQRALGKRSFRDAVAPVVAHVVAHVVVGDVALAPVPEPQCNGRVELIP